MIKYITAHDLTLGVLLLFLLGDFLFAGYERSLLVCDVTLHLQATHVPTEVLLDELRGVVQYSIIVSAGVAHYSIVLLFFRLLLFCVVEYRFVHCSTSLGLGLRFFTSLGLGNRNSI
jgi:hypothetical protein